jgi:iron(III) transport system substrate-binding protein
MHASLSGFLTTFTVVALAGLTLGLTACGDGDSSSNDPSPSDPVAGGDPVAKDGGVSGSLVVYCGRSDAFVQSAIDAFTEETGVTVKLKSGKSAALSQTLVTEGENSPADVFWAQDAGALGLVAAAGGLRKLSAETLDRVGATFRSRDGTWVGVTGRARVACFNTDNVKAADLPSGIAGFADPQWKGRLGWAPTNGSFLAFVTALRAQQGEPAARAWLRGIQDNEPKVYPKNTPAVQAVADGEIDVAFVNHYYLFRVLRDRGGKAPIENGYFSAGDIGNLVNVSGAGVVAVSKNPVAAEAFVAFLLSPATQKIFTDENQEYPLVAGVAMHERLRPLREVGPPDVDLNGLADLKATLALLRELGILN